MGLQTHPFGKSLSNVGFFLCVTRRTYFAWVRGSSDASLGRLDSGAPVAATSAPLRGIQREHILYIKRERILCVEITALATWRSIQREHILHTESRHSNVHLPHAGMPERAGGEHLPRHLSPGTGFFYFLQQASQSNGCSGETTYSTCREHILMSTSGLSFHGFFIERTHSTYKEILMCTQHTNQIPQSNGFPGNAHAPRGGLLDHFGAQSCLEKVYNSRRTGAAQRHTFLQSLFPELEKRKKI